MSLVVAVDIGGTTIKSALVDWAYNIRAVATAPTPRQDSTGEKTVLAISQLVETLSQKGEVASIGVGIPGVFDERNRISRWAGNLEWRDLPIGDLLQDQLNLPIACDHDVRAGTLAEMRAGAAKGRNDAVFIAIGTGISAGLVIDGAIRSAEGYAGEIGHLNVGHSYLCVCGKIGCLEALSSALSISNTYAKNSNKDAISAEKIVSLANHGDEIASQVWGEALSALARACEILITTIAPEVIVFGGGVSAAGEALISPISKSLDQILTFQRKPELRLAHFGAQAGMIGCAMLAFDLISETKQ